MARPVLDIEDSPETGLLFKLVMPEIGLLRLGDQALGLLAFTGLVVTPVLAASLNAAPGERLTGDLDLSPT